MSPEQLIAKTMIDAVEPVCFILVGGFFFLGMTNLILAWYLDRIRKAIKVVKNP